MESAKSPPLVNSDNITLNHPTDVPGFVLKTPISTKMSV